MARSRQRQHGKNTPLPATSHPNAVILITTQGAKGARMMNSKRCMKQGQGHRGDKEDRLMTSPLFSPALP